MIQSARPSPTFGAASTAKVHPCGALPACWARTACVVVADPKTSSSNHDSTHSVNEYSSPSASPGNDAVLPSAVGVHRWPSRTIPYRSSDPSPPDPAEPRAVTVDVPSPSDAELSDSDGAVGAPMPLPHTVAAAPDGLPPRPGGRSKREYGVTVIGLDVFEPTRYGGRSMLVSLRRIGIWTVSPAGLVTVIVAGRLRIDPLDVQRDDAALARGDDRPHLHGRRRSRRVVGPRDRPHARPRVADAVARERVVGALLAVGRRDRRARAVRGALGDILPVRADDEAGQGRVGQARFAGIDAEGELAAAVGDLRDARGRLGEALQIEQQLPVALGVRASALCVLHRERCGARRTGRVRRP